MSQELRLADGPCIPLGDSSYVPMGLMEGLKQLGDFGVQFSFSAFGVRIRILLTDRRLLSQTLERLPPGWTPDPADQPSQTYLISSTIRAAGTCRVQFSLYENEVLIRRAIAGGSILDALESRLQIHVAEFADPGLFVHAGVVGWQGRALVLPGSSFAGKSTLVHALVRAGATYYSDEYAVLDHEGRVLPYRRRISLRGNDCEPSRRIDMNASGPEDPPPPPLPIGLVAMSTYVDGADWQSHQVSGGAAFVALCGQTVAIRRRPEDTFAIMEKIVASATVIEVTRGEAGPAAVRLLQECGSRQEA